MKENNTGNTTNTNAGSMDIKVTGIRIGISQKGNVFVSMPDYKTGRLDDAGKDIYQDIAYPVTRQFRQELYDVIVREFHTVMEQERQQTGEMGK